MPKKEFLLDEQIKITIYKRKGSRNLRLSLSANGEVKVTMPAWASYKTGLDFAKSRQSWINQQIQKKTVIQPGQAIGKAHHIEFIHKPELINPRSRIASGILKIFIPASASFSDNNVQTVAEKASIKALRIQAENLLPQRLAELARIHNYSYGQVSIKQLKGRWGSCDQSGNIVLNLYLIQLPWELIDYVLLHELTHTMVLRHGPPFWDSITRKLPNVARLRKDIKAYSPVIMSIGS